MLTRSVQDYLKTIYKLEESGKPSTSDIARDMNLSAASVTNMLKRLAEMELVRHQSYKGAELTESGRKAALRIIRQHRLVELFLVRELGYSIDEVHEEAETLEHHISERFEERIDALMGFPVVDPHGDPIPTADGKIADLTGIALTEVPEGKSCIIVRVPDDDSEFLRYLDREGMIPEQVLVVIKRGVFDGPITILLNGTERVIGFNTASKITVLPENPTDND